MASNLKTKKLLDYALIGVSAVIELNTVFPKDCFSCDVSCSFIFMKKQSK